MKFRDMPKLPLALIVVMLIVGAVAYPQLPQRIPMHWGVSGQIDGWGAKSVLTVFFAPLMLAAVYLLLWFAPYLDPQRGNLVRSKQVYAIALELLAGMMTIVFAGQLYASVNNALPMSSIVEVATGVMLVVLGNYMGRVKRNWTMGFRYSWTLSDDTVWARTNRLGGRLFIVAGMLAIIGAFLPPTVGFLFIVLPIFVILPVTYVFAMRLYRRLHPGAMEPPAPLATPADDDAPQDAAGSLAARDPLPQAERLEVVCPACGAENAPGNDACIVCGRPLTRP
jgi:uncharacterized membrane protein